MKSMRKLDWRLSDEGLTEDCSEEEREPAFRESVDGVEKDLNQCLAPTHKGDFSLPGAALRSKGLNRIDIRAMNGEAVHASSRKTGMIILGGGLRKHHICNANMMRNGADFAVFINTAQEFDGSDSGARPDEAVSWGEIQGSAETVKVNRDATIAFPLLVAGTFAARKK
ncbi:hypothetical protein RJ639_004253 [Escallonia herrerae]|uniref:Deoxyhypusine synthase n=1 Tax=Escallonia herrerae TaxID=1293975 RepID=A0AA89B105_9ASTE|nr:hypothetical protein RJ639_004253 [Escallonia herrerae]